MNNTYKVRCSTAANVLLGLQKQSVVEDAVHQMGDVQLSADSVVVLKVHDLPLRIVVQVGDRIMHIVTVEEAEKSGVGKLKPSS